MALVGAPATINAASILPQSYGHRFHSYQKHLGLCKHEQKSGNFPRVHTLFNVKTVILAFIIYTKASLHDMKVMEVTFVAVPYYVFDRVYIVKPMHNSIHNT